MRMLGLVVVAALLFAFAGLAAACDDDGGAPSLEEYFQQLDDTQDENDARFAELEGEDEPAEDATGEELAQFLRDSLAGSAAILADSAAEADDLDPPDEVADEHAEIVAAVNELTDALEGIEVPDTLTFEELDQSDFGGQELTDAFDHLTTACNALEAIATENGITVDLACEVSGGL